MTDYAPRRPLGETIAELSAGAHGASGDRLRSIGIFATAIELSLPVETAFEGSGAGLVVLTDVPRFRRRTDFDLPAGRLEVRLVAQMTGEALP
ncbi:MAG TPA: hypothetical protein VK472_01275 [Allosphingosinicella sp.]|nr:hypothetical protein [Allosphingosinicella sp.]